ncbi:hypothetical protein HYS82_00815 [Candidatus Amesbacteria bacterium]|nr:hypothetical protein [Candidatus Amesbacteria bacterium]
MDLLLTPFTLGTSTVVTLPKKWGVTPPAKLKAKKNGKKITLEVINKQSQLEKDLALIDKLAGGMKYSSNLTPDEMNRIYDKEVYGD